MICCLRRPSGCVLTEEKGIEGLPGLTQNRIRTAGSGPPESLGFYVQGKDNPPHKAIVDDIIYDAFALQLALDRHRLVLHHICKMHCHQRGGVVNLQAKEQ